MNQLFCHKNIELPSGARTYCMRPSGHEKYDPEGKCDIMRHSVDMEGVSLGIGTQIIKKEKNV